MPDVPFLGKWPFVPKELFARNSRNFSVGAAIWSISFLAPFISKCVGFVCLFICLFHGIKAGYALKRVILIKNRISFREAKCQLPSG